MTAGTATEPPSEAPTRRAGRRGRVVLAIAVVLMVAMWAYVIYLAVGPGRQPPPDRLGDPAFAEAAEAVCRAAHADVDRLPTAIEAHDADDRADSVAAANARFATMLDDLAPLAPDGEDGEIVTSWLADWRTYLGDREAYVIALREDPEARLLVTAKDREQITEYIDAFAKDNDIPACGTPLDVS